MSAMVLGKIRRSPGVAGQYGLRVPVTCMGQTSTVEFVGSVYGGPIVMVTESSQVFIDRAVTDRIGSELNESWVRRFFAGAS